MRNTDKMTKKKLTIAGFVVVGSGSIIALAMLNLAGWALYSYARNILDTILSSVGIVSENWQLISIIFIAFVLATIFGGMATRKVIKEMLD